MDSPFPLKRHHHHNNNHPHPHPHPPPPPPHQQQPKLSTGEAQFRILCPSLKAGGVIGKGGAVIRQLREDTGARIRIIDDFATSHCDERVILISAASTPNPNPSPNCATRGAEERENDGNCSVAQAAVIKVFQRILKVDEERGEINNSNNNNNSGISGNNNNNNNNNDKINNSNNNESEENVVCRMLVGGNQVGSVLGRGGKIVESIRQDSGAQVRILPRDSVPACASPGDELIQIVGNFQAVKKALLLVTSCLQEHPRSETFQGANITSQTDSFPHRGSHAIDHHSRGFLTSSACENFGPNHRLVPEEDVVFKLLCPVERTGNLIGKGGFFVRGIQNETGASIKINEAVASNSDERVVVISARESIDLKRSPAQDAAIRVHNRIAEIGFEPGAPVVARLLVPSQQIGCLMGKGGLIINEMRRSTGAGIRIFGRDQGPKLSTSNDEVVQVIGNIQSVQDALFQITSRIRENIFPSMQHLFQESSSSYSNSFSELPSPSFRPRHDQVSPGHYHSPIGLAHSYDNRSVSQGSANLSAFAHGTERTGGANSEQDRHHFGGDRVSFVPERPPSPNSWYPQAVNNGHPGIYSDAGVGPSGVVTSNSQSGQMQTTTSVEVVVPQILLPHVYGENKTNISHITQFSGADVAVYDPKPGATEGRVVISGTPCQLHTAQSLVHAFILCGQAF